MKKSIIFWVLFLCLAMTNWAVGQHMEGSGNEFLSICADTHQPKAGDAKLQILTNVACIQYVGGLAEGLMLYKDFLKAEVSPSPKELVCLPNNATSMQYVSIVLKYVRDHPEFAHYPTGMLIFGALRQAFPCPSTAPSQP